MIVGIGEIKALRSKLSSLRIGFAAGTFDVLHGGHLDYLEWANEQCDELFVYVRSDERVIKIKNHRPLISQTDRARLVNCLKMVSFTYVGIDFLNASKPSLRVAQLLKPDVVLIVNSWSSDAPMWTKELPESNVFIYNKSHRDSSTRIIHQIRCIES